MSRPRKTREVVAGEYVPALLPPQIGPVGRTSRKLGNMTLIAHPEWVVEAAFLCYVRSARNVRATMRLLKQDWDSFAPVTVDEETGEMTGYPFPETMSWNTIYDWRRKYDWDSKANAWVAEKFPLLNTEQLATLIQGRGEAVRFWIDLLAGDYDHVDPRLLVVKEKAASNMVIAGGLGTHGTINRVIPVIKQAVADALDIASMDEKERGRARTELVRASKTDHPDRRR